MSKVKPVIELRRSPWAWDVTKPWKWMWSEAMTPCFCGNSERRSAGARKRAEAFLLALVTRLGVPDTPSLRKQIAKAVVVEK